MESNTGGINLEVVILGMSVAFVLALALILFFIMYLRRLRKQQTREMMLEASYQRELLEATINSQERERIRIGKELHDDLGAMLTTTQIYFKQLTPELTDNEHDRISSKMNDLLDGMIESTRSISRDLRPVILEKLGLIDAIQSLAETIDQSGKVRMNFSCDNFPELEYDRELNLYRVIQELIANTLKHAEATQIEIELNLLENKLQLMYSDNGVGMDKTAMEQKKGMGLKNIESRVSVLSATLRSEESQKGLRICIEVPLNDQQQSQ